MCAIIIKHGKCVSSMLNFLNMHIHVLFFSNHTPGLLLKHYVQLLKVSLNLGYAFDTKKPNILKTKMVMINE